MESAIQEQENVTKYRPLDALAAECTKLQEVEAPLIHTFTNGLYKRRIFLSAGSIAITKIHNTQHPYVILCGSGSISTDGETFERYEGPCEGVTEPGTQRFIIVDEDTVWITFHPNPDNEKDLLKIEDRIMIKYEIPKELIDGSMVLDMQKEPNEESLKLSV
jgi:hypothetical protein